MKIKNRILKIIAITALLGIVPVQAENAAPKLMPTPKSIQVTGGELQLTADSRIVAADPKLKPLAEIFSREVFLLTKLRLAPADGEPKAGDIVLKLNPALRADADILTCQNREIKSVREYAHTITVADMAVVEGFDYRAVCEGTASLLQAIAARDGRTSLPKMNIKDWPFADFTGIMIDCARQDIPLWAVRNVVDAARFWKVRYLHLHFCDGTAFVFPLKCHKAGTTNCAINNGDMPKVWDLEELKQTVAYADARGVTLVPELELPGHSEAMQNDCPEIAGGHLIDLVEPRVDPILDKVIGEICDVFTSSPYFHIGGDEIQFEGRPNVLEYVRKNGLGDGTTIESQGIKDGLMKQFTLRVNEMVKKRGKKTIFWGGHQGPPQIPELNDCISYSWYVGALEAQKAGFVTITVPWGVYGKFDEWDIFHSNQELLDRKTARVLGGSRPLWEMSAEQLMKQIGGPSLGGGNNMAERQERTWGPDTKMDEKEFRERLETLDQRLVSLVMPVKVTENGKLTGEIGMKKYFTEPITVTLNADAPPDCGIHYTTDGTEPTAASATYTQPFKAEGHVRVRAALFDKSGVMIGRVSLGDQWEQSKFEENLTTGKPAISDTVAGGDFKGENRPENAVDGWINNGKAWNTDYPPHWWQVDLGWQYNLDRIQLFPDYEGGKLFQYTVEVTVDQKTWTRVVDASNSERSVDDKGVVHAFPAIKARFVRVNMLRTNLPAVVTLQEVRVFEAGKPGPEVK